MRHVFRLGILVCIAIANMSSAVAGDIRDRLTDISPIPIRQGTNEIPDLSQDGRAGMITLGWRDNGNAHGYDVFLVMMETAPGNRDWNVILGPWGDLVTDYPHFGEDTVRSVRFVRARLDGIPLTALIIADRDILDGYPSPAKTKIEVYRIADGSDEVGTTHDYFEEVGSFTANRLYCNAEMAMQTELGIPVRVTYEGRNNEAGC